VGTAFTKVGFQLDSQPKRVIKLNFEKPHSKSRLSYELSVEEKIYQIFNVEMVVSLKGRTITLIYNYYNNEEIYNIIAYVLFYKFEVGKIAFLIGSVLPLYLTGHNSGLVLDLGYNQSTLTAVYDGYSLLHQTGYIGEGGKDSAKRVNAIIKDSTWE
jgi:actin-related protein